MAKAKKESAPKTVEVKYDDGTVVTVDPSKKGKLSKRESTGYAFIIPYVIAFCVFSVYPVFKTLYLSFTQYKGGIGIEPQWVGLAKYDLTIHDPLFWKSLVNTVRIWGVNIVLQLGLAFLLTIVFIDIKYKVKGLAVYRAIYYLPNIIAATSIAFMFSSLLDPNYGTFNQILTEIRNLWVVIYNHIPFIHDIMHESGGVTVRMFDYMRPHAVRTEWLGSSKYCASTIGVIQAWMWFGNSFIMLMAGVMGISSDYYEASSIDGAGRWKQFTKITLPLLKPIMLYVGVTSLIGGLQMFDLPQIMIAKTTASYMSIRTVIMYLYQFGFGQNKDVGRAAAIAYVLFFIILIFSLMQFIAMRSEED
ncbi:MAG: sugar ABC transporter permease [Lachnospiraceae bacterium]|nr:sugar ABC transporter permease [Lachnospiraceae bacterium]